MCFHCAGKPITSLGFDASLNDIFSFLWAFLSVGREASKEADQSYPPNLCHSLSIDLLRLDLSVK